MGCTGLFCRYDLTSAAFAGQSVSASRGKLAGFLTTHISRWSNESPVISESSRDRDGYGCREPQTHARLQT